jgi:hypothetical protein
MSVRGTILTRRRRSTGATSSTTDYVDWTGLASIPGLRGERQATNRLSQDKGDAAHKHVLSHVGLHRIVMLHEATLLMYIRNL